MELSECHDDPVAGNLAALAVLDDRGTVVGWCRRAQELLGYSDKDVIGRPAFDALTDDRALSSVKAAAARCRRTGSWFGVLAVRHRGGQFVEMGLRVCALSRDDGVREWFVAGALAADVLEWQRDHAVLDGMYRRCPIGLVVHCPELRILRVNRAVERFTGVPAADFRGIPTGSLLLPEDARQAVDRVRQVMETGRSLVYSEQYTRLEQDPARERVALVSAFRMEDPSGRVLGVAEIIEDITERHRAQRRLALLGRAGTRIGTTLDVEETARELAAVIVPHLADQASVDLLQPVIRGEEPAQALAGPVVRVGVCSVDAGERVPPHPQGEPVEFAPDTPQARCLADGRPVLEPVLPPDWFSMEDRRGGHPPDPGVHSLIVVPLAARGLVLGVMTLWRSRRPDPFETDDLTLAQELASRTAVAIDNARRFTQQQQTAFTLQSSLLPRAVPHQSAVEVALRYLPASAAPGLGGDWFDVIPLSGARVALVVGDVVGRGVHAAATMGRLRTAVHTLASLDLEPDEVLSRLDDLVSLLAAEQEAVGERPLGEQVVGATCLYAVYDPVSRRCSAARAGHPSPVVTAPDGQVGVLDLPAGPPLGLGGLPFEAREIELAEGSLLCLYTNGLIGERHIDPDVGLTRLRAALTRPADALERTCQAVVDSLVPARPADDIALLIARTRVLPSDSVASWSLPLEPASAAHARALASAKLTEWGLEHLAFTTELIVSELVTNAYRYASGPATLRLIRERCLVCEVTDASHTSPHLRRARTTDEGGRGLFLVAQMTERWGTRYTREGKTVWTEQPLAGTPTSVLSSGS
ncbi:SpoIIE family protein phosphatase [Streptomyces sp. NA02950]|uniref:ATP-binding SpoIIE family protein phosphatase n=1 Tax=Streptomyces sp. NA02950 TaxID=2742137 RepID=UPI0015918FB8|nr:SpoIIE family protein phosphatase [Streptomyces sp. NA02950]QKV97690.1 SpoIIE family protein phosphatase [Streptomyces sp. NA02950]